MSSEINPKTTRDEKIIKLFFKSHSMLDISKQMNIDIEEVKQVIFNYKPSLDLNREELRAYLISNKKNTTMKKPNKGFTGTKEELRGESFRQVKGSNKKKSEMSTKDPLYKKISIQAAIELDIKNELFKEVLNWITRLVSNKKKYTTYPYEDLLQAARTVAWSALDNYDFRKAKVTTYLTRYIEKSLDDEIRKMNSEFSLPEKAKTNIIKIRRFQYNFRLENYRVPDYQEISDALKISFDNVFDVRGFIMNNK